MPRRQEERHVACRRCSRRCNDLVLGDEPLIQNGYIKLPDKPGLGLTLNEDVARAHLRKDSTFFE